MTEGSSSLFKDVPSTNTSCGLFPLPNCFGSISSLVSKSWLFSLFNKIPMTRVDIFNFLCPIQTLAHSPPPFKPPLRTLNSSILTFIPIHRWVKHFCKNPAFAQKMSSSPQRRGGHRGRRVPHGALKKGKHKQKLLIRGDSYMSVPRGGSKPLCLIFETVVIIKSGSARHRH